MDQCIGFCLPVSPTVTAQFDGPQLTSDGGLVWLAEADDALGLCASLAAAVPEWRTSRPPFPGDTGAATDLPDCLWVRGPG